MSETAQQWQAGDWFRLVFDAGGSTGGQVLAVGEQWVALRLSAGRWDCAVGRLDLEMEPFALEHIVLPIEQLASAQHIEAGALPEEAEAQQSAWVARGQPVVHAPLMVLVESLSALSG